MVPGYLHEWDEAGNFVVELVVAECGRVELQQVVELRDHLYQSNICTSKKHRKRSFGCRHSKRFKETRVIKL